MYKRLAPLTVCLALAAFGASACGPSGDRGPSASPTPAAAPVSASAAPSGSPSATPTEGRRLAGLAAELYLRMVRKHYPELDRISDDVLVAHGNAFCLAPREALVDRAIRTKKELELTGKQASGILGAAHGYCGRKAFG
ncbi:hypothetical protein ABT112_03885 [Streptomyces sp. NPDC002055]|uniref:hypothetical protein n=1 Tax=Streptomyces sp. NPDC002055 TaxID=3154534 RepID=UPI00332D2DD9